MVSLVDFSWIRKIMSAIAERTLKCIAIAALVLSTIGSASAQARIENTAQEEKAIEWAHSSAEATESIGSAAQSDQSYQSQLKRKIKNNVMYAGSTNVGGDPKVVFRIEMMPSGEVASIFKIESSGIQDFDLAVQKGILMASPFPKKRDGTVQRVIILSYSMK